MVKDPVSSIVVGVRTSNNTNQRQILTVRTGDRIENAESTHGERDDTSTDAARASVAIGGVPGIQFVAATDVVKPRLGDEVVEEGEVEVAGDRENISDANLDEPASEVATQSCLGRVDKAGGDRVLYSGHTAIWETTHVAARWIARVDRSNLGVHWTLD